MTSTLSVRPFKGEIVLSKAQREFNLLTQKIAEKQAGVADFEATITLVQQRIAQDFAPLERQRVSSRAEIVRLFDRACTSGNFSAREQKKLRHLIVEWSGELIDEYGLDDLKPLFNKYSATDFDQQKAEAAEKEAARLRALMEEKLGWSTPEDFDLSTSEQVEAYFEAQMRQAAYEQEMRARAAAAHRANRPKTAKRLEKERKKAEEAAKITKSVRSVYLDLVKAFHPDREPDEAERQRKTQILQRVTDAYERNDLLALLQLQFELERIDQQHLDNFAEEQLLRFNKILRNQVRELDEMLADCRTRVSQLTHEPPHVIQNPALVQRRLDADLKQLKREVRDLNEFLRDLSNREVLKAWLKAF